MLIKVSGVHKDCQPVWAEIDDEDYEAVSKLTWSKNPGKRTTYAVNTTKGYGIPLHRFIMGLQRYDPRSVNHKDGNGLNNKRSNLELSNPLHNGQSIRKINDPRNVGCVYHYPKTRGLNKYIARIKINGTLYQKWVPNELEGRIWISGLIYDHFGDEIV